jgi:hypothetical protein
VVFGLQTDDAIDVTEIADPPPELPEVESFGGVGNIGVVAASF